MNPDNQAEIDYLHYLEKNLNELYDIADLYDGAAPPALRQKIETARFMIWRQRQRMDRLGVA